MQSLISDNLPSMHSARLSNGSVRFASERWCELLSGLALRIFSDVAVPAILLRELNSAIQTELKHPFNLDSQTIQELVVQPHQLPVQKWIIDPFVFSSAISTARILSVVLEHAPVFATYTEELMIAALLQDFGYMISPQSRELNMSQIRETMPVLHEDHPEVSAALVNGIESCPTLVSCLIHGHHWRTGLNPKFEHQAQQFLAIVVAFREQLEVRIQPSNSYPIAFNKARQHIASLAEQREFDARLCELFLKALPVECSLEIDAEDKTSDSTQTDFEPTEQTPSAASLATFRTFRFDSPHAGIKPPRQSSTTKPRLRSGIAVQPVRRTRKRIN